MYKNIYYEGFFFDELSKAKIYQIEPKPLQKRYDDLHITFKFNPTEEEIFDELIGKTYAFKVISYGNDGNNSGFEIEIPDELLVYFINYDENGNIKKPHITVSLSEEAKAVNTKNLDFIPLDEPFFVNANFGYCYKIDGEKKYSFEAVQHENKKSM